MIEATNINLSEIQKLAKLVKGSGYNLFKAQTIFPFVLFADTIKIDRQKVTIVHKDLFGISKTASIEVRNIINIQADLGPLFGSITLTSDHFRNSTQAIRFLKRSDVMNAQYLLQGFMIAHRANINTDNIDKERLIIMLSGLGKENSL
jgi:hypothetical protein